MGSEDAGRIGNARKSFSNGTKLAMSLYGTQSCVDDIEARRDQISWSVTPTAQGIAAAASADTAPDGYRISSSTLMTIEQRFFCCNWITVGTILVAGPQSRSQR